MDKIDKRIDYSVLDVEEIVYDVNNINNNNNNTCVVVNNKKESICSKIVMKKDNNDGLVKSSFSVVINSGAWDVEDSGKKDGKNSCLFNTICFFLCHNMEIDLTIRELRIIAGFPGGDNEMFDIEDPGHFESLNNIVEYFRVNINFHPVNVDIDKETGLVKGKWINSSPAMFIGDMNNIMIPIAAYSNHFELILTIDDVEIVIIERKTRSMKIITYKPFVHKQQTQRSRRYELRSYNKEKLKNQKYNKM